MTCQTACNSKVMQFFPKMVQYKYPRVIGTSGDDGDSITPRIACRPAEAFLQSGAERGHSYLGAWTLRPSKLDIYRGRRVSTLGYLHSNYLAITR